MFAIVFKLLVALTLRLHVPHRIVYLAIAVCYFVSSILGLEKSMTSIVFTCAYLLLAVGR